MLITQPLHRWKTDTTNTASKAKWSRLSKEWTRYTSNPFANQAPASKHHALPPRRRHFTRCQYSMSYSPSMNHADQWSHQQRRRRRHVYQRTKGTSLHLTRSSTWINTETAGIFVIGKNWNESVLKTRIKMTRSTVMPILHSLTATNRYHHPQPQQMHQHAATRQKRWWYDDVHSTKSSCKRICRLYQVVGLPSVLDGDQCKKRCLMIRDQLAHLIFRKGIELLMVVTLC